MANKPSNLLAGLANAKTRTFVILFGAVIVIGVGVALMRGQQEGTDVLAKQGSQAVGVPPEIKSTPGSIVSEQYKELQTAENQRRAEEALKKKTSAIPTIIGAVADTEGKNDANSLESALKGQQGPGAQGKLQFGQAEGGDLTSANLISKSPQERQREMQEAKLRQQRDQLEKTRLEKERRDELDRQRRQAELDQKNYEASVQKITQQMKGYVQGAYTEWSKVPKQAYVQGELANKPPKPSVPVEKPIPIEKGTKLIGSKATGYIKKRKEVIKAGTVLFGVLDTAVNSDENGPVLATIVSGKYRGGKMLGAFTHKDQQESVIIQFNTMSVPKKSRSISVQAVAVDPDTARTALASDVDHHYLLRYGSLFASAFVSGYGKAITQQGTTTTSPLTGTTTTTTPPLDNQEKLLAAFGEVGTAWAQQVKPIFNTPYTVTVDQGTGIGLLFLSDVDVSEAEV